MKSLTAEKVLCLFLVVLATSMGLAFLRIPNQRSYWPADFQFVGTVEGPRGAPSLPPFQFNNSTSDSMLTMKFEPYIRPFISFQMASVARTFVSTIGTYPTSTVGSFLAEWSGNSSGVQNYPTPFGWDIGDGAGDIAMKNGTIWVTPQTGFLTIYNLQNRFFSSNISDLILVRLSQVQNAEWFLNVLVNDTWVGLSDLQGLRVHQSSGTFAFELSKGLGFKNPSITVTLLNSSLPGFVRLSTVEFGHIVGSGSVFLTVNGNASARKSVFPTNLTSNWPSGMIQTDLHFPPGLLSDGTNTVVISTEGGVSWTITAIVLHIYVNPREENPQAWTQLPSPLVVYGASTGLLLVVSIWSLRKFMVWLKVTNCNRVT